VGGGFTGVSLTSNLFNGPNMNGPLAVAIASLFIALYAFVVVAGLLFVYDSRRTGPMLIAFALQIPWVSLPVFEYHFAAGLNAAMAFGPPRVAQDALSMIDLSGHFETAFQFRFGEVQEGPWRVGINLFAVLLYVLLRLSLRTLRRSPQPAPVLSAD
jgi:hypothetical protein